MDLIKNLLADKKSEFTAMLVEKAGFAKPQAEVFVPAATSAVADAAGSGAGFDMAAIAGLDPAQLIGKVDIGGLASKVGVDSGMVTKGLTLLVPMILGALKGKAGMAGNLGGVAGALGGGGGLGAAAKGAGKLFGR